MTYAPNLLDAIIGAGAEGIEELVREIALRIGARPDKIEIVISCRKSGGSLIGIYNHDKGPSIHKHSTGELLAAYAAATK